MGGGGNKSFQKGGKCLTSEGAVIKSQKDLGIPTKLQHDTTGVHSIKMCQKHNINAQNNNKYLQTTLDFPYAAVFPTKMIIPEPLQTC